MAAPVLVPSPSIVCSNLAGWSGVGRAGFGSGTEPVGYGIHRLRHFLCCATQGLARNSRGLACGGVCEAAVVAMLSDVYSVGGVWLVLAERGCEG